MSAIRAVFGLGNPGPKYDETRHNAGFLVLDRLAETMPLPEGAPADGGEFREVRRFHAAILRTAAAYLVKPMTFMNASGEAVSEVCRFYRIPAREVLIVYDDMDLPLGRLRFRNRGSSGGHNGIKSIIRELGDEDFPRLKIGIGRRKTGDEGTAVGHVLGRFAPEERRDVARVLDSAAAAVMLALEEGLEAAMTHCNGLTVLPEDD